jgi:hypothetical protein
MNMRITIVWVELVFRLVKVSKWNEEHRLRVVLNRNVTGDESWCFICDPETKRQSAT